VQITSHNHGFAVAMPGEPPVPGLAAGPVRFDTAYGAAEVTHVNLNDGVVEGLRLTSAPAFAVQYHPEAAPGPHDATGLFAAFSELMEGSR
jgi:carbamoyl-phosphate synthase small subunit